MSDEFVKPITPEEAISRHAESFEKSLIIREESGEKYLIGEKQLTIRWINDEIVLKLGKIIAGNKPILLEVAADNRLGDDFWTYLINLYWLNGIVLIVNKASYDDIDLYCFFLKDADRIEAKQKVKKKGWLKRIFG